MNERSLTHPDQVVKPKLFGASPLVAGLDAIYRAMHEKEEPMDEQAVVRTIEEYCRYACEENLDECKFCPLNFQYEDDDWWALLPLDNQRGEFLFSIDDRTWLYCQHECPKVEGEPLRVGMACLTCKLWPIRPVWLPESDRLEELRTAEIKRFLKLSSPCFWKEKKMLLTEAKARTKECRIGGPYFEFVGSVRHLEWPTCSASACMAWDWFDGPLVVEDRRGFCGRCGEPFDFTDHHSNIEQACHPAGKFGDPDEKLEE